MTIDRHSACAYFLNIFNMSTAALDAQAPSLNSAHNEFHDQLHDVVEICGLLDMITEDGSNLGDILFNMPLQDTLTTPNFYADLFDVIIGMGVGGVACLSEMGGALLSEQAVLEKEKEFEQLNAVVEAARLNYVDCLRDKMFEKARR